VVVPSAWGTVDDWKSVGVDVDPNELGKGVALNEDENTEKGTVIYHATQTVGYKPVVSPAREPDPIADDIFGVMAENLQGDVTIAPFSFYDANNDRLFILLETGYENKMRWLNVFVHEVAHATGATNRLDRPLYSSTSENSSSQELNQMNNEEELVAELTSSTVLNKMVQYCAVRRGVPAVYPPELTTASAQYLWLFLPEPRSEVQGLQWAVTEAEKAADSLLAQMIRN
jgi:antirestriction protein ArdC